jgi:nitric oxide reductase subunit C
MGKVAVFLCLFVSYTCYSFVVYTKGTESKQASSIYEQALINRGKQIFQQKNCTACHQVYGLGGYLGPDLTKAWSDKSRGEVYLAAILKSGGARMPDYHFNQDDINGLLAYLKYIDLSARKGL